MASQSTLDLTQLNEEVAASSAWVQLLRREMSQVVVGQTYLIDRLLVGLLANGHVLLEGVPGLAKTLTVKTLAQALKADFSRIQFTPDLLPADVVGTLVYNPQKADFFTQKGPVFANIVLADEINRAPAKVQAALLEAMQEGQVTLGNETFALPFPFLVLATENPVDQEGTYPLPEAQVDRFMLKVKVGYPKRDEELKILESMASTQKKKEVKPVVTLEQVLKSRSLVDQIYVDDKIKHYIVDLVMCTRTPRLFNLEVDHLIQFGASPRATIALTLAAKAWAFLNGSGYVTPQFVKDVAMDVLRHRVILSYEAEAEEIESEDVVKQIFDVVPVP